MKIRKLEYLGLVLTFIFGVLLHFVYDWSGRLLVAGLFSPVNESTWEHLKLLAVPFLLWELAELFLSQTPLPNLAPAKLLSLLAGMGTIVTAFYTYSGILGKHILAADIGVFGLGVLVSYWLSLHLLQRGTFSPLKSVTVLGWAGTILLAGLFFWFTLAPPHIGLFLDPVTGGYGIP